MTMAKPIKETGIGTSPSALELLSVEYRHKCALLGDLEIQKEIVMSKIIETKRQLLDMQNKATVLKEGGK